MWAQILNVLLGLWLMAAPTALGLSGPAVLNDRIVGPIAASFACVALSEITRSLRWGNLALGLWQLAAPWVFGFEWIAVANSTAVGVLLVAFAFVPGPRRHSFGGGWASLWRSPAPSPSEPQE
jgi:hypothetical protein